MNKTGIFLLAITGAVLSLYALYTSSTFPTASSQEENLIRSEDTVTILLDLKKIPPKEYMHIYDSSPMLIASAHVAMKVPCDKEANPVVKLMGGVAPRGYLFDINPIIVGPQSIPGKMCIYHHNIPTEEEQQITDIAIVNPSDKPVRFPRTSSVVIHVHTYHSST